VCKVACPTNPEFRTPGAHRYSRLPISALRLAGREPTNTQLSIFVFPFENAEELWVAFHKFGADARHTPSSLPISNDCHLTIIRTGALISFFPDGGWVAR
jgi:hypothetical protein